ncbi:MAG: hypothetical protein RJB13_898 [Pseudomonadota bacterium]
MRRFQYSSIVWSLLFVGVTSWSLFISGGMENALLGTVFGLILTIAWHVFVLEPSRAEKELGEARLQLNLQTRDLSASSLRRSRKIFAVALIFVWLVAVLPSLYPSVLRIYAWAESQFRTEEVLLSIEFPSYLETPAQKLTLKGDTQEPVEVDQDAYLSVLVKYRKPSSLWQVEILPASPSIGRITHSFSTRAEHGLSVSSIVQSLSLEKRQAHLVTLSLKRNNEKYASIQLNLTPQPRPFVELNRSNRAAVAEGLLLLDVSASSKIPLSSVEFHVRTESGYRLVKPIAEFANASENKFQRQEISFTTRGIPFTPKDTLYIKAVAKTLSEALSGESQEIAIDIVTQESLRQDLLDSLKKSLSALQQQNLSTPELKRILERELDNATRLSKSMGQRSTAAKQMDKINSSADQIQSARDNAARQTEKRIKSLIERLQREQTSNQVQNLLARLQNLKYSIQRSEQQELPGLTKDTKELKKSADTLKKQLREMVDKPSSGLTLKERQVALDALQRDATPEFLDKVDRSLSNSSQTEALNQAQSTLDHAQKNIGSVLAMLQAAKQRSMREAREKLTRADSELQNARNDNAKRKRSLDNAQSDLDSLPSISDDFEEAAKDAQSGNQKARQGAQRKDDNQLEQGLDEAQDGIVRALAALQDEEEAQRESQQEQDGQSFRNAQEALEAQSQLDMGWRRQILEEIARLRENGTPADDPAIRYLESRLR